MIAYAGAGVKVHRPRLERLFDRPRLRKANGIRL